jgi:hypothetical protein
MTEKKDVADAEVAAVLDVASGDLELSGFDAKATKKLLRRLDWHIIPFMSLIYLYVSHSFILLNSCEGTNLIS